ncbi:PCD23 protein, partial [Locustella ochotensis]|nr:PCD23 protein [Locustella ochotensis]
LTVSAWDGGGLPSASNAAITVNILQTVLVPAIFERSRYSFSVPEDAPEDSVIGTVKAREPPNSLEVVSYRICSGDPHGKFSIDPQFGIIHTKKQLDHETQPVVVLTVQSQLGNSPVYSSTQVNISVTDINDNAPVFPTKSDKVTISHTQPPGTAVYIAHAEDKDSGLNGAIKYSIASKESDAFSIDPSLGVVNLTRTVFAEKQQEYTLHIAAEDCGSPPLTSLLMCKYFTVADINDNSPSFVSSPISYVMEDVDVGFLVHHIIAKDPDEGRNGQLTYHILSGNENKAFVLDKITGLLTTAQFLDREVQERYSLTVIALDDGSPALSATQVLTIVVLDVNDETPVFLKQLYETAVHENRDPGEFVIRVEAVDQDEGLNSLLQYEILPGAGYEKFKMNSDSGELVTAASLDRETQEVFSIKDREDISNFTLVIECHDLGSPSRTSTAQLYLTVLDENDHSPLFAKTQYQISVTEDLEEGSAILDLSASDEDAGLNGEVMYSLIDGTYGAFAIDSVTGSIITTKALDRETKSQYTFRAVASDCSTHFPRSTTVSVVVHIDDVNDNDPIFLENPIRVFLPAETAVNETVATVRAEDVDLGSNGAIVFNLMMAETVFQIDVKTGDIILREPLDSKDFSTQLVVTASDQGIAPRTATAMVIIFTEEQEEVISFSHSLYEASVPENSAAGGH